MFGCLTPPTQFESCQPPFPLPCLYWITFTIPFALACSHVTVCIQPQVSTGKWKWSLFPSLAEGQELPLLTFKGCCCQPLSPSIQCRGVSDSGGKRKLWFNWHPREGLMVGMRRLCLVVVGDVSAGPAVSMEGKEDRVKSKWRASVQGKAPAEPGTSAVQWQIAPLRTTLAFLCWMRWSCSSPTKVFLHLSKEKFSQVGLDAGKAKASDALQARNKSKAKPTCGTSTRCYLPLAGATSELLAHRRLLYFICKTWGHSDLAHQGKVWVLWRSRWKRKCVARSDSQSKRAASADPELKAPGVWGVSWKDLGKSQGRRSTRAVQIAGQKMCLHHGGIFKPITHCCKTKPPTMLLVGRGHRDSSRQQAWKQQSSQACLPWFYRPGSKHTSADVPAIHRKDELWSQQCFLQKLRDDVSMNICFDLPFGGAVWSRLRG